MTLIALVDAERCPILLGDILISSTLPPSELVDLPTVGQLATPIQIDEAYYVTGLRQKVCIVTDTLAVAWSGPAIYALHALRHLQECFRDREPSPPALRAALRDIDPSARRALSLICLLRNENRLHGIGMNAVKFHAPKHGRCLVAGSGAEHFIKKLSLQWETDVIKDTPMGPHDLLISTLGIASDVIADEVVGATRFEFGFGGGIEVAVPDGDVITKIGDIVLLFATYDSDKPEQIALLNVILKLEYYYGYLIVRRIEIDKGDDGKNFLKAYKLYAVAPFHVNPGEIVLKLGNLPNMSGTYLLHHIALHSAGRLFARYCPVAWSDDRSYPFLERAPNGQVFALDAQYIDDIMRACKRISENRP